MNLQNSRSRSLATIFVPVFISLVVAAAVALPLFQDGSSYLFELLNTGSAIRNNRPSVYLIQAPSILLRRILIHLHTDPDFALQLQRFVFSLNYALVPFFALILSWLVVRRRQETLFVWAVLIVLFVNLVNFSWVSELLIALQLACPLFLASLVIPGSKWFWLMAGCLLPVLVFLHPLVLPILLIMALGALFTAYWNRESRSASIVAALIFMAAAVIRLILALKSLTPYETSFLQPTEMTEYLWQTSVENRFLVNVALVIGILCLLARSLAHYVKVTWILCLLILLLQVIGIDHIVSRVSDLSFIGRALVVLGYIVLFVIYVYRYLWDGQVAGRIRLLYASSGGLAVVAAGVLLSQYLVGSQQFPLKTGHALFTALMLMLLAAIDLSIDKCQHEAFARVRLIKLLAIIFSLVILAKSWMWHTSVALLEQSLARAEGVCLEIEAEHLAWLEASPYTIINNWALPSLTLVMQDTTPRKLLLAKDDCASFLADGMIQIDPWSKVPQDTLKPRLN